MKYCYLVLLFIPLIPANFALAASSNSSKENIHKTCAYKYLECRDSCEYHQDQTQISGCLAHCNRTYHCRPKAVPAAKSNPKSNPLEN